MPTRVVAANFPLKTRPADNYLPYFRMVLPSSLLSPPPTCAGRSRERLSLAVIDDIEGVVGGNELTSEAPQTAVGETRRESSPPTGIKRLGEPN